MSADWVNDINRMQTKFGVRNWIANASPFMLRKYIKFRYDFLKEEMEETREAIIYEDSEELVDGLIDLCVVAIGTLDALGVNPHKAWDTVMKANMAKEAGVKPERPNPLGIPDMIKPKDWKAPSHEGNHGLIPQSHKGNVQEEIWTEEQEAALEKMIHDKELLKKAMKANKARTEISGKYNTKWTPDAIEKYGRAVETIRKDEVK